MNTAPRHWRRRIALCCALAAGPLAPAMAADFALAPGDNAIGGVQEYVIQKGDVLADIARHFDIGYTEILAANPRVDPWVPPVGKKLLIPALYILPDVPHQGLVINLGERRLYYFPPGGGQVQTYPIGIGATGFDTPHDATRVVAKVAGPTWVPPPSIRAEQPDLPGAIGPGPDNPLGAYELRLGWKNYLIHGTNKPDGVGRNVSHGCIHLYPEDIEKLFKSVAIGTPVRVVEQSSAAAWIGNALYVEAHPDKDQADEIDIETPMTPRRPRGLRDLVGAAAGEYSQAVVWSAVDQAGLLRSGLPVEVGTRAGTPVASTASPDLAATAAPTPLWPGTPVPAPPTAQGPRPVFHMLKPPREVAQSPPNTVGIASQPVADDDEGPIRLWPGGEDAHNRPAGYDAAQDPDRPAWDRRYR